MIMSGCLSSDS